MRFFFCKSDVRHSLNARNFGALTVRRLVIVARVGVRCAVVAVLPLELVASFSVLDGDGSGEGNVVRTRAT